MVPVINLFFLNLWSFDCMKVFLYAMHSLRAKKTVSVDVFISLRNASHDLTYLTL